MPHSQAVLAAPEILRLFARPMKPGPITFVKDPPVPVLLPPDISDIQRQLDEIKQLIVDSFGITNSGIILNERGMTATEALFAREIAGGRR